MKIVKNYLFALSSVCLIVLGMQAHADESKKAEAEKIAKSWAEQLDQAQYNETWEASAEVFQKAMAKEKWNETIAMLRKPLGKVLSRKLKSNDYMTSLPGAEPGHYYVIQFETQFENHKTAIETITPSLEKDGKLKVAGYYIK